MRYLYHNTPTHTPTHTRTHTHITGYQTKKNLKKNKKFGHNPFIKERGRLSVYGTDKELLLYSKLNTAILNFILFFHKYSLPVPQPMSTQIAWSGKQQPPSSFIWISNAVLKNSSASLPLSGKLRIPTALPVKILNLINLFFSLI